MVGVGWLGADPRDGPGAKFWLGLWGEIGVGGFWGCRNRTVIAWTFVGSGLAGGFGAKDLTVLNALGHWELWCSVAWGDGVLCYFSVAEEDDGEQEDCGDVEKGV